MLTRIVINMTNKTWLGTISPPYESPCYWILGESKEGVKEDLVRELNEEWGEEIHNPVWQPQAESYQWLKDTRASAEVRTVRKLNER